MIDWDKPFPVVSISRTTLREARLTDEQIAFFTDEKMMELASMIFIEGMHFLDDIHIIATHMLAGRFDRGQYLKGAYDFVLAERETDIQTEEDGLLQQGTGFPLSAEEQVGEHCVNCGNQATWGVIGFHYCEPCYLQMVRDEAQAKGEQRDEERTGQDRNENECL